MFYFLPPPPLSFSPVHKNFGTVFEVFRSSYSSNMRKKIKKYILKFFFKAKKKIIKKCIPKYLFKDKSRNPRVENKHRGEKVRIPQFSHVKWCTSCKKNTKT
jgi:hypothetical protein